MTIRGAFIITFALLGGILTALAALMWMSGQANKKLARAEARRYASFKLADELRQSSDDLTRMARSYAATGNPVYRKYFQAILDIRNGTRPRPENYDRAYWDLIEAGHENIPETGKSKSLLERMRAMRFTAGEFAILEIARVKSNELAEIEKRSMAAVEGRFQDARGNYTVAGSPDPELAMRLLHSDDYSRAKAGIMGEINRFFDAVETRTAREVRDARAEEDGYRAFTWPLGLLSVAVSVVSYFLLLRYAVNPIHDLANHAEALSRGEYRQHVLERGFRGIGSLSRAFNSMSDAIVRDIERRDQVERELKLAKNAAVMAYGKVKEDLDAAARIQQALLPTQMPEPPGVGFAYAYAPCDELAGDTLNVFQLSDHHIGIYLIDVSGHGVQAALLASTLSHLLIPVQTVDSILWEPEPEHRIASPATVARLLNERFPMNPDTNQYFTIHYGILDVGSLEYTFVSAGHPGPIHVLPDGRQETLRARGAGIGILREPVFEEKKVRLAAGERMLFFSDGVLEASNENGEEFRDSQLSACVRAMSGMTMKQGIDHLIAEINEWSGGDQQDDVSALLMRIDG